MSETKDFAQKLETELKKFLLENQDARALVMALAALIGTAKPESWVIADNRHHSNLPETIVTPGYSVSLEELRRLKLFVLLWNTLPGPQYHYFGGHSRHEKKEARTDLELKYLAKCHDWCKTIAALSNNYEVLTTGFWAPVYAKDRVLAYLRYIRNQTNALGHPATDNLALIVVNGGPETHISITLDEHLPAMPHDYCLLDALDNYEKIPIEERCLNLTLKPQEGRVLLSDRWASKTASKRRAGILLHPTSLPSNYGVGDLGVGAMEFVEFLAASGQKLWQVLPLNPPGYGDSPYQCLSAFAGNPLLIDVDHLIEQGLLPGIGTEEMPVFSENMIDFAAVSTAKSELFKRAFQRFQNQTDRRGFDKFCRYHSCWLEDYSLFMALKSYHQDAPWPEWEHGAAHRKPKALAYYKKLLQEEIEYHKFLQYQFFHQWLSVKSYANSKGIAIVGDLPIYAAHDSSDVWVHREEFCLDEKGYPIKVAGVPPDAFSRTGQRWGNPIYRWDIMEQTGFRWWRERLEHLAGLVDIIRIDHFRGFEAYWEVPADEDTAINGRWVKGPGKKLFDTISEAYGNTQIIAEDLGFITPAVEELRNQLGFPGMSILQFDILDGKYTVPLYKANTVAYTGTHDNETILSWYKNTPDQWNYVENVNGREFPPAAKICRHFIEMAMNSDAETVIIPLQDILCLDNEARMNVPGTATRNWGWRFTSGMLDEELEKTLKTMTGKYRR